jgi:hypothetical protein
MVEGLDSSILLLLLLLKSMWKRLVFLATLFLAREGVALVCVAGFSSTDKSSTTPKMTRVVATGNAIQNVRRA